MSTRRWILLAFVLAALAVATRIVLRDDGTAEPGLDHADTPIVVEPLVAEFQLTDVDGAAPVARTARADVERASALASIRVRVVRSSNREPIRGAHVTLVRDATSAVEKDTPDHGSLMTDAMGVVEKQVEPGIAFQVSVEFWSRPHHRRVEPVAPGDVAELLIELPDPIVLRGRVLARETGAPIADATVVPEPLGEGVRSRGDGSFELSVEPSGASSVRVGAEGRADAVVRVDPAHGTRLPPLEILLDASASLRVLVLGFAGGPVVGATVEITAKPAFDSSGTSLLEPPRPSQTTDRNGVVAFEQLAPGLPFRGIVRRPGAPDHVELDSITLSPGERRSVTWRLDASHEIRGLVLDENGGVVPGQRLWLDRAGEETAKFLLFYDVTGSRRTTVADAAGAFRFSGVEVGRWWLAPASAPPDVADPAKDPVPVGQLVVVTDSESSTHVDLRLQRGLTIEGRIVGPDGVTPAEGTAMATRWKERKLVQAPRKSDATRFVIGPLHAGTWTVSAVGGAGTARSEPVDIEAGTKEVVLRLRQSASIAIRVLDASGDPVGSASVLVSFDTGWIAYPTKPDGVAEFRNLTPGTSTVSCSLPDGRWAARPDVLLEGGQSPAFDLTLEQGVRGRITRASSGAPTEVLILHRGALLASLQLGSEESVDVTLPIGDSTLRTYGREDVATDHEIHVAPDTSPVFTFDGEWK